MEPDDSDVERNDTDPEWSATAEAAQCQSGNTGVCYYVYVCGTSRVGDAGLCALCIPNLKLIGLPICEV